MNIEGIDIDIEGTLILKELKGHLMSWIQYLSINSLYSTSVPSLLTKPRQFVRKRKKFDVFSATGQ